jgi:hypothetical protein
MDVSDVPQLLCVACHAFFCRGEDKADKVFFAGLLINCNIATYLTGSALIPLGLTWWQAIIGEYQLVPCSCFIGLTLV